MTEDLNNLVGLEKIEALPIPGGERRVEIADQISRLYVANSDKPVLIGDHIVGKRHNFASNPLDTTFGQDLRVSTSTNEETPKLDNQLPVLKKKKAD
jgi:hypothetical protein